MTTLKDKIRDAIQTYNSETDVASDPEVLVEAIVDEIKDYLTEVIG